MGLNTLGEPYSRSTILLSAVPTPMSSFRRLARDHPNRIPTGSDLNNNMLRQATGDERGDTRGMPGEARKHVLQISYPSKIAPVEKLQKGICY